MVDDCDFDYLNQWRWKLNEKGYACRNKTLADRYEIVYLHREVADRAGISLECGEVDHRDRNKLNCVRTNLRVVTHQQNCWNAVRQLGATGVRGVFKNGNRYTAQIRVDGRKVHLGMFTTPEEAGEAYTKAREKHRKGYIPNE